jgi:hypothetical protein
MLRSLNELRGYVLAARDGEIGRCHDFLFDDLYWTVRYMVADTAKWLPGRRVLLSPLSLRDADWASRRFAIDLERDQVKHSPPLDSDAPVTRRYERQWYSYYGWPMYWGGPLAWGSMDSPGELRSAAGASHALEPETETDAQSQLRSLREVVGYEIEATDGSVGHIDDFIAADDTWTMHYLVVDTRKWLPAKRVLFSTQWLECVDWTRRCAKVELTVEQVKGAPAFRPSDPVNREIESRLYDYYGRPLSQ